LPESLREAVLLFEYEHKSYAEIAEIVGASAKAVETRLHRAREQLRKGLGKFLSN
jgi:RNA polymerase sigma-70 factor (ECF subfamily)